MKKVILIGVVCLLRNLVLASVINLEQTQASHDNVVYQYTFEGATTADRLDQKISPNTPDLVQNNTSGQTVTYATNSAPYVAFDSSSYAAFTKRGSANTTGAALKSTNGTVNLTSSGTIEYLVNARIINDSSFAIGGLGTQTNSGMNQRWYFFYNGAAGTDKATMTLGANVAKDLIGGASGVAYNSNDWYYVAQTWSISGTNVTLNAWVADLTTGGPLTQTINNANNLISNPGTYTNMLKWNMRLGSSTDSTGYFGGGLDSVAIYNTTLDAATIESHFNTIPEPSTLGLFGMALLGLLGFRRFIAG